MADILKTIEIYKRAEIEAAKRVTSEADLRARIAEVDRPRGVFDALRARGARNGNHDRRQL